LRNNKWSKIELASLRAAWKNPDINVRRFAFSFTPARSEGAVRQKAHALGLLRKRAKTPKPLKAASRSKTPKLKAAASRKKSARRSSR
jgi:hypothetical protein